MVTPEPAWAPAPLPANLPGAVEVAPGVHWIGAMDPTLRTFDIILRTANGTSYNAYLVRGDEGVAVVDTVKLEFAAELFRRLESVADYAEIRVIEQLGATFRMDRHWGRDFSLADLRREHDAVFLAIGAQRSAWTATRACSTPPTCWAATPSTLRPAAITTPPAPAPSTRSSQSSRPMP